MRRVFAGERPGDELYAAHLTEDRVDGLYGEAIQTLLQLQQTKPAQDLLAQYDAATLRREMELFPQWFIGELLQYSLNDDEQQLIAQCFSYLEQAVAKQPKVVVHRDFHSRNLIYRQTQQGRLLPPGLIDFQDALIGPASYDLVSLLKDCYVDWPKSQVRSFALAYYQQAQQQGIWPRLREGEFIQGFDLMGLQRHIKVLGIFARLSLRDNKHGYLQDLPRVLAYTLDVLGHYPALASLHQWFYLRLMPLIEQQSWYYPINSPNRPHLIRRAMIFAAGEGRRMLPLTASTPKPLLPLGDSHLIGQNLRRLSAAGIEEVIINTAYLGEQIQTALGDGRAWGLRIIYSPEPIRWKPAAPSGRPCRSWATNPLC